MRLQLHLRARCPLLLKPTADVPCLGMSCAKALRCAKCLWLGQGSRAHLWVSLFLSSSVPMACATYRSRLCSQHVKDLVGSLSKGDCPKQPAKKPWEAAHSPDFSLSSGGSRRVNCLCLPPRVPSSS